MSDSFHLIDLVSQAAAVQRLLRGAAVGDKLSWLSARGKLSRLEKQEPQWPDTYYFESGLGAQCAFVLQGDEFVFLGDHCFFTAPEEQDREA